MLSRVSRDFSRGLDQRTPVGCLLFGYCYLLEKPKPEYDFMISFNHYLINNSSKYRRCRSLFRLVMAIDRQNLHPGLYNEWFKPSHIFIVHEKGLPFCLIDLSLVHFVEQKNAPWASKCVTCNIVIRLWVLRVKGEHHLGCTLLWEKNMNFTDTKQCTA